MITTATDLNGLFAVDVWAKSLGCVIADITKIKAVSSALLRGEPVGLDSDFPIDGPLPQGLTLDKNTRAGIRVSWPCGPGTAFS